MKFKDLPVDSYFSLNITEEDDNNEIYLKVNKILRGDSVGGNCWRIDKIKHEFISDYADFVPDEQEVIEDVNYDPDNAE